MELKRPWITRIILRKEKGAREINLPNFRLYSLKIDSYSHQDSMVLAEKQKCRPME